MELENAKSSLLYTSSHYPFYNVVSFGVHRGELHIRISSEPNRDEKRKFYPISYGITGVTSSEKYTLKGGGNPYVRIAEH